MAKSNLSGGVGKRITGGLRGEGRRTRQTGVDFNDPVVQTVGLESVLNIALSDDSEMADNLDGSGTKHVVLLVTQCLRGRNDNRVSGVDSERVKVLHVANSDTVVGRITHDLILNFLPALERLLDQDLRRKGERASRQIVEFLPVVGKSGAETSESISGSDDNWVSDRLGGLEGLVNGSDSNRFGNGDIDLCSTIRSCTIFKLHRTYHSKP